VALYSSLSSPLSFLMGKILVENRVFTRFWNTVYFLRLTSLVSNNWAFVQRSLYEIKSVYKPI
jgi:hypothetical protein